MSQPDAHPSSEPSNQHSTAVSRRVSLRQYVLFGLLVLMMGALWYEFKVARPHVESAFDQIEQLNQETNSKKSHKLMTNKDVQTALNTAPSDVFSVGGYQVERYSWRAGLPIKTRDYYAVFSGAPPHRFLRHYKFELPMEELTGHSSFVIPPDPSITGDQTIAPPVSQGSGGSQGRRDRTRPVNEDAKDSSKAKPSKAIESAKGSKESSGASPSAPAQSPASSEKPSNS